MDIIKEKKQKSEDYLVGRIRDGDSQAFEQLFFEYFADLCSYAFQLVKSDDQAKDVVQEVFFKIWKRRSKWVVHTSLKAYLFRAVRNESLNLMNKKEHQEQLKEQITVQNNKQIFHFPGKQKKADKQLLKRVWQIVEKMPDRRQSVFVLHRKHGLSYKEIAQVLDISRKTVENHMGLALEDIRADIDATNF